MEKYIICVSRQIGDCLVVFCLRGNYKIYLPAEIAKNQIHVRTRLSFKATTPDQYLVKSFSKEE